MAQLRLADPAATWDVRRFNGLPYLASEAGFFVEVAVTVQGVTLSQIHPVLDGRNRPLLAPTAFDINTSLQRCLVKAIALHGLGLYVYAGEDLPQPAADAANDASALANHPVTARPTVRDYRPAVLTLTGPQQGQIHRLLIETGTELNRLLEHFGVVALKDLPASQFTRVVRSLEKRRAAA